MSYKCFTQKVFNSHIEEEINRTINHAENLIRDVPNYIMRNELEAQVVVAKVKREMYQAVGMVNRLQGLINELEMWVRKDELNKEVRAIKRSLCAADEEQHNPKKAKIDEKQKKNAPTCHRNMNKPNSNGNRHTAAKTKSNQVKKSFTSKNKPVLKETLKETLQPVTKVNKTTFFGKPDVRHTKPNQNVFGSKIKERKQIKIIPCPSYVVGTVDKISTLDGLTLGYFPMKNSTFDRPDTSASLLKEQPRNTSNANISKLNQIASKGSESGKKNGEKVHNNEAEIENQNESEYQINEPSAEYIRDANDIYKKVMKHREIKSECNKSIRSVDTVKI